MNKYTPYNVCSRSTASVLNTVPKISKCTYCGSKVVISKKTKEFSNNGGKYPWIYHCTKCDARVGIHPNTNIPLGTLANAELRWKRRKAKTQFKQYMSQHNLNRSDGYTLLAATLGISRSVCHFGWFDIRTCNKILIAFRTGMLLPTIGEENECT
jgi:DNA-directed RNA polymerase subunit RPC12/RpoP